MTTNVHQAAGAAATRQRILDAMPGYPKQLATRAGVSISTVHAHLQKLHGERFCFIKKWKATTGLQSPYWVRVEDAPRPAQDRQAYCKKYYLKNRAPVEKAERAARKEALANAKTLAEKPHTWASALLGVQL